MGKKKKSQEYSSDSTASSDSDDIQNSKKNKKTSKKSKKHKKKSKKKSKHQSSSESSVSDAWVEQNVDKKKSPSPAPVSAKVERDDWMSSSNFFLPTYVKEKQKPKTQNEKEKHEVYDPVTSSRELNPYYKTGEGGMPSSKPAFQRPKVEDDGDYYRGPSKGAPMSSSSRNWRKPRVEDNRRRSRSRSPVRRRSRSPARKRTRSRSRSRSPKKVAKSLSRSRSRSPQPKRILGPSRPPLDAEPTAALTSSDDPPVSHSDFLTDQQLNEIGAKMLRAEMMGKTELAAKFKEKLDRAKAFKASGKAEKAKERESVLLTITNAAGTSRPIAQNEESSGSRRPQDKKKNKRVETHEGGERTRYYPDDDKYDIKTMFEREKLVDGRDQDIEFAKAISKVKDSEQMDMADIFSDNIRKDKHKKSDEREEAVREHQRMEKILDSCNKCFDSPKMDKDLVVYVGKKIYLAIPYYQGLVNHHLVISPIQHVPCSTMVDEDVWEEISNLKKALTQFFFRNKEDVVFFETVRYLNRRPHMEIHCVANAELEMIQFYFKKAIQESEKATLNKKLIEIKADKSIRKSVPRGLPYFWVDFGSSGMAHVIEDQETFPPNFAQEIIGGMMNLDVNKWRKPRKEHQPKKRVDFFNSLLKSVLSVVKCLICNKELKYTHSDPSQLILHVKTEHPQICQKSRNSRESGNQILKNDLKTLKKNSGSLNSLIDREIQTEIDWRYFEKMNSRENELKSRKSLVMTQETSHSSSESKSTVKEILSPPKTFSSPARKSYANEKTPLRSTEKVQIDVGTSSKAHYTRLAENSNKPKSKHRLKFYQTSIEKWRPVGDEKIHCPRCKVHKRPVVRTHTDHTTTSSLKSTLVMTCWPLCFAPCLFPEPTHEMLHCPVCNFYLGTYDHRLKEMRMNPDISDGN